MILQRGRLLCGTLLAGGALAATALAADPSSGTISNASPKVAWTGSTAGSYAARIPVVLTGDDSVPCVPPTCDTFALTLGDAGNLTVGVNMETAPGLGEVAGTVTVRIRKPDDSVVVATSGSENDISKEKYFTTVIKNAATGEYTIEYWNNSPLPETTYSGFAQLPAATPAPTPGTGGGGPGPGPGPEPGPGPGVPGGSTQAIDLQVKVGKTSARKLKKSRKLPATITVSREVSSVTATLKKGSKVIGTARRGATSGTARITVAIAKKIARKLKKGSYKLSVVVTDGNTSTSKTVTVKVPR